MRPLRHRRSVVVLLSVLAGLLVGVQPAAAYTVVSHTGVLGPYSLTDAGSPIGHQGATCFYKTSTYKLTKIEARRPVVKARNRTSGRDSQWVSWQVIVQHQTPSGTTWATVFASTFTKALAYDNQAAPFANRTWTAPATPTGKYRVLLVIRWYTPGSSSTIQGQVKLRDSFYESKWNGYTHISEGFCLQDY